MKTIWTFHYFPISVSNAYTTNKQQSLMGLDELGSEICPISDIGSTFSLWR